MFHREESEEPCPSETSQGGQGSQPCGPNGADLCASEDDMMRIWGMDPVHPSKTAYTNMAVSIIDEIESVTVLNSRIPSSGATVHGPRTATTTSGGRRTSARENWTSGSQTIVERHDTGPPPPQTWRGPSHRRRGRGGRGGRWGGRGGDTRTASTQAAADTKLHVG